MEQLHDSFINKVFMALLGGKNFKVMELDQKRRVIFLNSFLLIGSGMLCVFGLRAYQIQNSLLVILDFSMLAILFLSYLVIKKTNITRGCFYYFVLLVFLFYLLLVFYSSSTGTSPGYASLWLISFPLISIYFLGVGTGAIFSVILGLSAGILSYVLPSLSHNAYNFEFHLYLLGVYLLNFSFTLVYESSRKVAQAKLETTNRELTEMSNVLLQKKTESDRILYNVNEGIFLLDEDLNIGTPYSRALEDILQTKELTGKSLMELLVEKVPAKELKIIEDYLRMCFDPKVNLDHLKEKNPLAKLELNTIQPDGSFCTKYLDFHLSPLKLGMARVYLLATLRDITETIVLQSQLKLEEQKNQQRMATLYQIIHIQPAVLEQFILNTGAELEKINSSLKANEQDYAGIIKVVYQSIMTIKENVVSLGLEELGRILLYLEDYLETLKNKPVEWQDLLNLTLRVSTVQNEINNLKALFVKLGNYQVKLKEMGENQSELLLNPLKKILEESGKKLGKEIRLNTDNFDANLIDKDYRSVVKDVLIHLVQNAITHGIETPEQRQAFKKEAAGNIYLSCLKENGKLQILFKDDGQGLNPEEIRSKIRLSEAFKEIDLDSLSPSKVISLIFHPDFSTTKKTDSQAVRGTTGMYAVKAQIEQQGGSLAIRTMPGKSCEFRITLPG